MTFLVILTKHSLLPLPSHLPPLLPRVNLATGKMPSPWIPTVAGSLDTSQFDSEFTSMMPIGKKMSETGLRVSVLILKELFFEF